jgi:hypothetical protein
MRMTEELDHTADHRNCPACEALRIEVMGLDIAIRSLGHDQAQRIKGLAKRAGIHPTSLVDTALDAFEKRLYSSICG